MNTNDMPSCARCGAPRRSAEVHRCPGPAEPWRDLGLNGGARAALDALAGTGRPFVVGGAVRDALLREAGRTVPSDGDRDVDIEVHGCDLPTAAAALRAVGAVVVTAGTRFAVLKVVLDGTHLDVAVVDGAGDDGALTDSAARRDFTVNAIAWDPVTNEYVDPSGGVDDAVRGILRHASDRFGEDPLRVLRAVQLVSRFGFAVHPASIRVARTLQGAFTSIATERIWPEVRKTAEGDHLSAALGFLHASGWERHFAELAAVRDVPQDPRWHPEGPVHVHAGLAGDAAARACTADGVRGEDRVVIVLGAVLHDLGKAGDGTRFVPDGDGTVRIRSLGHETSGADAARSLLRRLAAPRSTVERIVPLVREHMVAHSTNGRAPSVPAARRLVRRLGGSLSAVEAWARVCEADSQGRGAASGPSPAWAWFAVALRDALSRRPDRLLAGRDLIEAGLAPGPVFREVLDAANEAQDEGRFVDAAGARAWLREALDARP
ncbi:HD domain-containing protein [Curtobacterium sp. MCJR17_020]|uniref:HD domain-containing protein n=1 Tax=Curtobacterium sp. MCJR17_020 TaxID=2175619 RepID=UPI000DA82AF5|nr:HD domain-containing protein [Curtobacterium sp. MCJR17_020]WIE70539.1 HD domain-containing protein [Curtobacterium sp. MCJR17_020]